MDSLSEAPSPFEATSHVVLDSEGEPLSWIQLDNSAGSSDLFRDNLRAALTGDHAVSDMKLLAQLFKGSKRTTGPTINYERVRKLIHQAIGSVSEIRNGPAVSLVRTRIASATNASELRDLLNVLVDEGLNVSTSPKLDNSSYTLAGRAELAADVSLAAVPGSVDVRGSSTEKELRIACRIAATGLNVRLRGGGAEGADLMVEVRKDIWLPLELKKMGSSPNPEVKKEAFLSNLLKALAQADGNALIWTIGLDFDQHCLQWLKEMHQRGELKSARKVYVMISDPSGDDGLSMPAESFDLDETCVSVTYDDGTKSQRIPVRSICDRTDKLHNVADYWYELGLPISHPMVREHLGQKPGLGGTEPKGFRNYAVFDPSIRIPGGPLDLERNGLIFAGISADTDNVLRHTIMGILRAATISVTPDEFLGRIDQLPGVDIQGVTATELQSVPQKIRLRAALHPVWGHEIENPHNSPRLIKFVMRPAQVLPDDDLPGELDSEAFAYAVAFEQGELEYLGSEITRLYTQTPGTGRAKWLSFLTNLETNLVLGDGPVALRRQGTDFFGAPDQLGIMPGAYRMLPGPLETVAVRFQQYQPRQINMSLAPTASETELVVHGPQSADSPGLVRPAAETAAASLSQGTTFPPPSLLPWARSFSEMHPFSASLKTGGKKPLAAPTLGKQSRATTKPWNL